MLDVLHYLLDEDLSFTSGDEAKYKNNLREMLYKTIYNKKYKFSSSETEYLNNLDDADLNAGISREVKPYIPPTNFNPDASNPFKGTLKEEPLG